MGYERYLQNTDPRGDYDAHDDFGQSRNRGPRASDWDRGDRYGGGGNRYAAESYQNRNRSDGNDNRYGSQSLGNYRGSYASDGRRFVDDDRADQRNDRWSSYGERSARETHYGFKRPDAGAYENSAGPRFGLGDNDRSDHNRERSNRGSGREGYDYEDRGMIARAGDEVRSWFGDDEAERRRNLDQRYDDRIGQRDASRGDADYDSWRRQQIEALDRDYDEYRRENQSKFHSEFSNWRDDRQGQRSSLSKVQEHMEVIGSDGGHIGTVDKVRGDRIILTKNDENAGGHHHSIPSRWIQTVDERVTVRKTAEEAMKHWKDEERNQALFDDDSKRSTNQDQTFRNYSGTF